MRTIRFLLEKEFRQIFRNKSIRIMILAMPVIQLLILPQAANYEVRNINLAVSDHDHSGYSRQLTEKITSSGYFKLVAFDDSFQDALHLLETDEADVVLEIPPRFERKLVREQEQHLFMGVNAINGSKASLGGAYLNSIIRDYNDHIRTTWAVAGRFPASPQIRIASLNWFNPLLNYQMYMVPGIMAILVTLVGGFLTSLNIVREKEVGTIEQINVTPIRKHHFILGKLIPFWVLGNVVFSIGLLIAWIVYGIVPLGSLFVLYGFTWMYLLAIMGFGLLVSTYTDTQQQAMFIMFFFMMIFILMGGLFTPIDSMPVWAKTVSAFNPVSYFIQVMRMVMLKGSGWTDILPHLGIIAFFAVVLNSWAILNYRKTS